MKLVLHIAEHRIQILFLNVFISSVHHNWPESILQTALAIKLWGMPLNSSMSPKYRHRTPRLFVFSAETRRNLAQDFSRCNASYVEPWELDGDFPNQSPRPWTTLAYNIIFSSFSFCPGAYKPWKLRRKHFTLNRPTFRIKIQTFNRQVRCRSSVICNSQPSEGLNILSFWPFTIRSRPLLNISVSAQTSTTVFVSSTKHRFIYEDLEVHACRWFVSVAIIQNRQDEQVQITELALKVISVVFWCII